jgi:hypothetical protein
LADAINLVIMAALREGKELSLKLGEPGSLAG